MKRFVWIAFVVLVTALPCSAQGVIQGVVDGFVGRLYQSPNRRTMLYRLFIPEDYTREEKYPLIVWLHGLGGAGDDNALQLQDDQVPGTHLWTSLESQSRYPAFVVAPQSPVGWIRNGPNEPSSEILLVLGIIASLQRQFSIDPNRLYIAGQSDGGFGVWNIITHHPEVFAAAIIVCGGGNPNNAERVAKMPIWVFHGEMDDIVPVQESRQMVDALTKAGGKPRYTEYKDAGHNVWTRAFAERDLPDWLFSQHK